MLLNSSKHLKAGTKGLDEGCELHMRDVSGLLNYSWKDLSVHTVARRWRKADVLPRVLQGKVFKDHGKGQERN